MKKTSCWPVFLMVLSLSSAQAANQEIRALFQPDPSQPNKNEFINKTPNSGYCASFPSECEDNRMFSIQVPIRFSTVTPLFSDNGVWVKVPADWRRLTVTNQETLETSTVEVRISGIGSRFQLSKPVTELTGESNVLEAHRKLWTGNSWVYAPPPCLYSGVGYYGISSYQFFWKTPEQGSCNKTAAFDVGHMLFEHLDIAYELRTPNPLSMSSGLYTGSLTYSLGRGSSDFTMGPFMDSDDTALNLDFVLDVQHVLKVDLPPGGNRIALEPDGGWQTWLNTRKPPARLYRDQTFHISASSRFKVHLECARDNPNYCYLFNEANNAAALLQVKVSLPGGLTDVSGNPVRLKELLPGELNAVTFQPGKYIDRQQGTLHFEVPREWTETILTSGRGNKYSGTIVVVFDSEISPQQ
ncbi:MULTISPECIES: hypothetical protein [unclassified Pseudomonas]|uniref:hypothetical protein n=1 Tax=unclassified Pseudomonas TaxID=196821 RepID=UPI000A1F7009|nr:MULTISPECIES: hypothetical protein [unclassified Pseudomonas]